METSRNMGSQRAVPPPQSHCTSSSDRFCEVRPRPDSPVFSILKIFPSTSPGLHPAWWVWSLPTQIKGQTEAQAFPGSSLVCHPQAWPHLLKFDASFAALTSPQLSLRIQLESKEHPAYTNTGEEQPKRPAGCSSLFARLSIPRLSLSPSSSAFLSPLRFPSTVYHERGLAQCLPK